MLAFGNRNVLVFSRLVELSPVAWGKAHQRHLPDNVFVKNALSSKLLASAGVDLPEGEHVLCCSWPSRGAAASWT